MKKLEKKKYFILILAFLWLACQIPMVQAHSVELDPKGWISLPSMITSSTAHATISSSAGDHQFYYQLVFLTDEQFNTIQNKIKKAQQTISEEREKVETLESKVNEALELYKEEKEKDASSDATAQAKTAYEQAYAEYKTAYDQYLQIGKKEEEEINASVPSYVEAKWKQANDGSMQIDYGERTGKIHFVLWGKLVANEGTYYDCNVYSTSITGTSVTMNKTNLTLKVGDMYTLTATSTDSTQNVVWSSSNEKVATVDQKGVVKALKEGTTTIYAKLEDGSAQGTCMVTVEKASTGNDNQNTAQSQGNIVIPTNNTQTPEQVNFIINRTNQPTNVTGNLDNTKADGTIPQAGANYMVIMIIAGFAIIGLIAYRKYRKYNF